MLDFPFPTPPAFGCPVEVAPGVLWLRLPLPFRLNHVNSYLVEGRDGWTIIDAGVDDARTRALWADVLAGLAVRRILVTHYHPDHVGAAAHLAERTGAPLLMGETEYLTARHHLDAAAADLAAEGDFYRGHGLGADATAAMGQRLARYRDAVPGLPPRYRPLRSGDSLDLGGRRLTVYCHAGHSPAQMLLHAPDEGLFFAADHVLPQISPNVSVAEDKPDDDPLGLYLASFTALRAAIPGDVLVLPGHRLPFRGLHARLDDLARHHDERCARIVTACRGAPLSAADLVPVLFPIDLDPHQLWFAFSEALAHVNFLHARGRLTPSRHAGVTRWHAT